VNLLSARISGGRAAITALAALALALCASPPPAGATALETIVQDDAQLLHRPDDQLRRSLEELQLLGVDRVRVTAGWSVLTRDPDSEKRPAFDASDPAAYEQDRWRNLDRIVALAPEYGLKTMIDIAFWAPHWASHDPAGERGRSDVDVQEFSKFATAVARRYSGSFIIPRAISTAPRSPLEPGRDERYLDANYGSVNHDGPTSLNQELGVAMLPISEADVTDELGGAGDALAPLPKVDTFTIWNEPNHPSFLRPQWVKYGRGWVPSSPHVYRAMLAATYPAIKAVRPDSTVLVGGTSFTGSYRRNGSGGVPPLKFLRELACVNEKLKPLRRSGCTQFSQVLGDGWAHHPYTMQVEPDTPSKVGRPDDVPIAEMPKLAKLLDRLAARGRLSPGLRNIWITEYGYETNPPVKKWIFSPGDQAHFLTWAEYIAAKTPQVKSFAQFLLRDLPPSAFRVAGVASKRRAFGQWQSGLLFEDGTPKLGAYSFRGGIFVQHIAGSRMRIYGRLRLGPGPRTVLIERRPEDSQSWTTLMTNAPGQPAPTDRFTADGKDSFTRFAPAPKGVRWRYRLRYLDGDTWRASVPAIRAVER
jgi:hypothetical protein